MKQIVAYIRSRQGERPLRTERRRETRRPSSSPCTYGLMRSVNRDEVTLEEGQGAAMNESFTGMRCCSGSLRPKGSSWKFKSTIRHFGGECTLWRSVGRNR
jgi:hypothetical protein